MLKAYEKYMKKCIALAKKGEGFVSPNPLVGAVVLDKNNKMVGYGWHKKYGEPHAEVNAINMAKDNGADIRGGTVIVSLEPCSHFGKTPPCADLIINEGLKKVVVGCVDPNPKVAGNGIKKLQKAGIDVMVGVLEKECQNLNEIFIKNQTEQMPFVAIKTATTMDGKIATKTGSSKWITSEKSRIEVQKLRNKYDAILTGSGTVLTDNPSLTCRIKNGRNPIRVIIDSKAKIPLNSKVFNEDGTQILWVVSNDVDVSKYPKNIKIIKCPTIAKKIDLNFLVGELYNQGVRSILVEAGGLLNGEFLKQNLVDKIYQFIAPKILGDEKGKNFVEGFDVVDINDSLMLEIENVKVFLPDVLLEARVLYR